MCVTRALTIKRGRQFLMITIGMAALTGCGYFADNWEATGNKCQSLSSEENATAVVARENVVFMNMESGCAPRLASPDYLDGRLCRGLHSSPPDVSSSAQ